MIVTQRCIDLIKQFEGFKKDAYLCPAGVPTIGFGSTMWADGRKVKLGEMISIENAEKLLRWHLNNQASALINLRLNQNQYDALNSFIFNIGRTKFLRSTLYRKALKDGNDKTIRDEFMRWVNKGTPYEKGLTRRREAESKLYYE